MPPSKSLQIERMMKRVDIAIHNPTADTMALKRAIAHLKEVKIELYREDYDHWIRMAIEANSEKKIRALMPSPKLNKEYTLSILFEHRPKMVPSYVSSCLFHPNVRFSSTSGYVYDTVVRIHLAEAGHLVLPYLKLFFKQPRSGPIALRLYKNTNITTQQKILYLNPNPSIRKRKRQRLLLLRFWLLTTKKNLLPWRESLYVPGTGALYKKAFESFKRDGNVLELTGQTSE
jgi:hypothetical protein